MTEMFLERSFDPPLTAERLQEMVADGLGCFGLHRVDWVESLWSADSSRLVCHFRGPDAESIRIALRSIDADTTGLWRGSEHLAPGVEGTRSANVIVTRSFTEPVTLDEIQAIEDAGIGCLQAHRVRFERTFFSVDRRRMVCLYRAPDAESVRMAQREAGMPLNSVWAFRRFSPETL
jgi:hypothetical protein